MARIGQRLCFAWLCSTASLVAQPQVLSVFNAASWEFVVPRSDSGVHPSAAIAPGSIFVVSCLNCGPQELTVAPALPLPTVLAGTSVRVGGLDAYMVYTSNAYVAAVLPSKTSLGLNEVIVGFEGQSSAPVEINVAPAGFGVFSVNAQGFGPGSIQNYVSPDSLPLNGLTKAANPGQFVVLYGTGLGPVDAPDNEPPGVHNARVPVEVLISGKTVKPTYAGRAPKFPGLDQVNFALPADVFEGCYVPLAVRASGRISNTVTIAVSPNGSVCDHPFGLPEGYLRRLDEFERVPLGVFYLENYRFGGETSDRVAGGFGELDANELFIKAVAATTFGSQADAATNFGPTGSCLVKTFRPSEESRTPFSTSRFGIPDQWEGFPRLLDAGNELQMTGPRGQTIRLTRLPARAGGHYSGTFMTGPGAPNPLISLLELGRWTLSGDGGTDVPPFTAGLDVPDLFEWTDPIDSIDRTAPLTVNWTGGGAGGRLYVVGISRGRDEAGFSTPGMFTCTASIMDKTFSVPLEVLAKMPPSSEGWFSLIATPQNGLVLGQPFEAPARAGSAISGRLILTMSSHALVEFK